MCVRTKSWRYKSSANNGRCTREDGGGVGTALVSAYCSLRSFCHVLSRTRRVFLEFMSLTDQGWRCPGFLASGEWKSLFFCESSAAGTDVASLEDGELGREEIAKAFAAGLVNRGGDVTRPHRAHQIVSDVAHEDCLGLRLDFFEFSIGPLPSKKQIPCTFARWRMR